MQVQAQAQAQAQVHVGPGWELLQAHVDKWAAAPVGCQGLCGQGLPGLPDVPDVPDCPDSLGELPAEGSNYTQTRPFPPPGADR